MFGWTNEEEGEGTRTIIYQQIEAKKGQGEFPPMFVWISAGYGAGLIQWVSLLQEGVMKIRNIPGSWKAVAEDGSYIIQDKDGHRLATVEQVDDVESVARLIVTSPLMLEALKGLVTLIGDEGLEDNGELSGAAVCDMAREAVALAEGVDSWDWKSYLGV